jgi:hypothetical protein
LHALIRARRRHRARRDRARRHHRSALEPRSSRSTGAVLLEREAIRFHHLPLFDGRSDAVGRRRAAVRLEPRRPLLRDDRLRARPIAKVVTVLARTPIPRCIHCAAGKDRTGVISALLLSLLGVREEIIVADYAATREALEAIVERLMASDGYQGMFDELPPDTLHADPETMEGFLARVRSEFGGMAAMRARSASPTRRGAPARADGRGLVESCCSPGATGFVGKVVLEELLRRREELGRRARARARARARSGARGGALRADVHHVAVLRGPPARLGGARRAAARRRDAARARAAHAGGACARARRSPT